MIDGGVKSSSSEERQSYLEFEGLTLLALLQRIRTLAVEKYVGCITWENEIFQNTSWKVKNRQQSCERENSDNCNTNKKRDTVYILLRFKYQNIKKYLWNQLQKDTSLRTRAK